MNYLFGSRIITHILFWLAYYFLFGFIWTEEGDYGASYFLEFILLPIRIGVTYACLYLLLPKYLLEKRFIAFITLYMGLLLVGSIMQRLVIYFFFEQHATINLIVALSGSAILRSVILINSTALFLLSLKILKLYFVERAINTDAKDEKVEIRSEKRFYRISPADILYLEGLGNYITYHLKDGKKIIGYGSLKKAQEDLPHYFSRIHKSFLVNGNAVRSYDNNSVEIGNNKYLPIGNSYSF